MIERGDAGASWRRDDDITMPSFQLQAQSMDLAFDLFLEQITDTT